MNKTTKNTGKKVTFLDMDNKLYIPPLLNFERKTVKGKILVLEKLASNPEIIDKVIEYWGMSRNRFDILSTAILCGVNLLTYHAFKFSRIPTKIELLKSYKKNQFVSEKLKEFWDKPGFNLEKKIGDLEKEFAKRESTSKDDHPITKQFMDSLSNKTSSKLQDDEQKETVKSLEESQDDGKNIPQPIFNNNMERGKVIASFLNGEQTEDNGSEPDPTETNVSLEPVPIETDEQKIPDNKFHYLDEDLKTKVKGRGDFIRDWLIKLANTIEDECTCKVNIKLILKKK